MKNYGITAMSVGTAANFVLFLTKVYVGISSNSLAIYCDAINNLGDTLACLTALGGFILIKKFTELQSKRAQSLVTFVISLIIAVSGFYFVYNGAERVLYPLPVSYSIKYAILIGATIGVKILLGLFYWVFNKKSQSPMLKAMVLDSVLDCFITLTALIGLILVPKINFALDGVLAVVTGIIITVSAVKNIIEQSKYLINN